ncbi:MAG TPA: hypothetical protein VK165_13870 [Azonexus sp.]|nr:hypothetical protein [Azonexus sp.]
MDIPESAGGLTATAHQTVDRIADAACRTAEGLARQKERLNAGGSAVLANCRTYVNENPGMSLGVAVAAGFLLRHLIRPR